MDDEPAHHSPGGFHMYNINEMVSVMGKRKKMPTTLGINNATGVILIAPEKARDGPEHVSCQFFFPLPSFLLDRTFLWILDRTCL
jgi:hypothetical protein